MSDVSRLLRTLREIHQLSDSLEGVNQQLVEAQRRVQMLTEQREHLLDTLQMTIHAGAPAAVETMDALQTGRLNVASVTE